MSRTGALVLLILVTAAIVSGWLKISAPSAPERKPQELAHADYFMTDFDIRQYDERGEIAYRMRGQRMEHYPTDDSAVIEYPDLNVKPGATDGQWTVTARHARAPSRELDTIVFRGEVDMQRPATAQAAPMRLRTERLVIEPDAERLSSEQTVVLTGPGARIEGRDLRANLKQGTLRLSRVRGRYAP